MMRLFFGMLWVAKTPHPWIPERRRSITIENISAAGPVAYSSHVDVHEVRVRVEADTAELERRRGLPQLVERDTGHADVDRLPYHVQRVDRHAGLLATPRAKHQVRLRGAIS